MTTDANPLKMNWILQKIGQGMPWILAAFVFWFLFIHRLGDRDLWSSHEARSGMNARTILDGGIWWLPGRTNDLPDVQKPPLYYWIVAVFSEKPENVSPLTIRLPSTLGAIVCIFSVFFIGKIIVNWRTGFLAAMILGTSIHFVWSSRIGRIDMPLAGAVTCYFLFALRFVRSFKSLDLLMASLMVTISILLKGPIGLVLCGLSALALFLTIARNHSGVWGLGLTGFLGLVWAIPWFWAVHLATNGEFSRLFFIEHNLDRGFGSGRLRSHPIWFYPVQFLWDFQPWTTIIPLLFFYITIKNKKNHILYIINSPFFYILIFISSFLSISSFKRADYLIPAYPAASLIFAIYLNFILSESNIRLQKITKNSLIFGFSFTFFVFSWLLYVDIPTKEPSRLARTWAAQTKKLIEEDEPIIFFGEEAHSLAFHLNRDHEVLGSPDDLREFMTHNKPTWVFTNPQVLNLWPSGPPGINWETVTSNIDEKDGRAPHKPLVLLKAFPASKSR